MQKILTCLFLLSTVLLCGQSNQLMTRDQRLPCLNKKFTIIAHFVLDIDGETGYNENDTSASVDALNDYFAPICVSFEVCEFREVPNYNYWQLDMSDFGEMLTEYHQANRINVFYVDSITGGQVGATGFASFAGITNLNGGGVVLANAGAGTLAHEMGHYFGLEHTFAGNGSEFVNGDNCETVGDGICDTPADPFVPGTDMDIWIQDDCRFIFTGTDANGEFYRPDVGNIMSYYPCTCGFTNGQFLQMAAVCQSSQPGMW